MQSKSDLAYLKMTTTDLVNSSKDASDLTSKEVTEAELVGEVNDAILSVTV